MTTRFRKQQKLQKWTESIQHIPSDLNDKIIRLGTDGDLLSKYIQTKAVFERTEVLHQLLHEKNPGITMAILLEILFIEPAKQLHKHILSALKQFPELHDSYLPSLIRKYIVVSDDPNYKNHEAPLVVLFISLIEHQLARSSLEETASEMCRFLCKRIESVLTPTIGGSLSTMPWQMEETQEAVSIAYALLTQFSAKMTNDVETFTAVAKTMLWLLQNELLVRDAMPSAGVTLWVAIQQPMLTAEQSARLIVEGYLNRNASDNSVGITDCLVEKRLLSHETNLIQELRKIKGFGQICSLKGIISILKPETLLQSMQSGCLLKHILGILGGELSQTLDMNMCFHLLCAITTTLSRQKECFQTLQSSEITVPAERLVLTVEAYEQLLLSVWRHMENAVHQTERQAVAMFNALMDVVGIQDRLSPKPKSVPSSKELYVNVMRKVTALDNRKKGKFILIQTLVPRIGAQETDVGSPDLVSSMLQAFSEGLVCKAAGNALTCFLKQLQDELPAEWLRHSWMAAFIKALLSDNERRRNNLITYFVPLLAQLNSDVIPHLLPILLESGNGSEAGMTAVVSILKIARQERYVTDLDHIVDESIRDLFVPLSLLIAALHSRSVSLSLSVLELACVRPKPSDFPGEVDYTIVEESFKSAFRTKDQPMRNEWQGLMERFMVQLRVASHASFMKIRRSQSSKSDARQASMRDLGQKLLQCQQFLHGLTGKVICGLYPGASISRRTLSLELIHTSLKVWDGFTAADDFSFEPFCPELFTKSTVEDILGCLNAQWDYLRNVAASCLNLFPVPLPGFQDVQDVQSLLNWSWHLVKSPRLRENDCGARLLILLHKKYECSLNWSILPFPDTVVHDSEAEGRSGAEFFISLVDAFESAVSKGEEDLLEQCRHCLAHGVLLAIRYFIQITDWPTIVQNKQTTQQLRTVLKRFWKATSSCCNLCLSVLQTQDVNVGVSDNSDDDSADSAEDSIAPDAQLLTIGTWLSIKEISIVFGTMAQRFPFKDVDDNTGKSFLLDQSDFEIMGNYFVETLTRLKHNGAVEKTAESLQAVCECLLRCNLPQYRDLPNRWVRSLLDRAKRPNQSRDDIIRRSGGFPFGLAAIFRAEPKNMPKVLLPIGVQSLLDVIQQRQLYASWTRIHALHIMRHVFNDKTLATNASAFVAQGVEQCLISMSDDAWEVRNAAGLCFATLATRMVGYKNKIQSGSNQKSISAFEFFFRYPSLLCIMTRELKMASEILKSATSPVPVALGPILLLLARLLPSESPFVKTPPSQQPTLLLPYIQSKSSKASRFSGLWLWLCVECLVVPQMAVRQSAARAFVPLVVRSDLLSTIDRLLEQLSQVLTTSLCSNEKRDMLQKSSCQGSINNNALHGYLMAIRFLLEAWAQAYGDNQGSAVLQRLDNVAWMLFSEDISNGVKQELIRIVSNLPSSLPDTVDIAKEVRKVAREALTNEVKSVDVMHPLMLQRCTEFLYKNMQISEHPELLEITINHESYDVRLQTLRSLYQLAREHETKDTVVELRPQLHRRLRAEDCPMCVKKCLKVLTVVYERWSDGIASMDLWNILMKHCTESGFVRIRQYALTCMGYVVRDFLGCLERDVFVLQILQPFEQCMRETSAYQSATSLRYTTLEAVERSTLMKLDMTEFDAMGRVLLFSVWKLVLAALEDEEIFIRHRAAYLIESLSNPQLENDYQTGSYVEKDLFKLMSAKFSGERTYLQWLLCLIVHEEAIESDARLLIGEESRRLFAKDADNKYTEALFKSQLAAEQAAIELKNHHCTELLTKWTREIVRSTMRLIEALREREKNAKWLGIARQNAAAFVSLYRCLLGLHLVLTTQHEPFLESTTMESASRTELVDLLIKIDDLDIHQLHRRLIQRVRSDTSGNVMDRIQSGTLCDTFVPLFLL